MYKFVWVRIRYEFLYVLDGSSREMFLS